MGRTERNQTVSHAYHVSQGLLALLTLTKDHDYIICYDARSAELL